MAKKIINNMQIGHSWTTYIGSVHGVLVNAGLWDEDVERLMGMTGMAFHFIAHYQACPSSVTVYDWFNEHFRMMDRIGIVNETMYVENDGRLNTFKKAQGRAVDRIRDSIDRGMGVVVWAPTPILEFGIITGYDDGDKVFHVMDCLGKEPDPLLYSNLGRSEVPVLFIQLFYERVPVDNEKIFRDSLEYGAHQWEKESHIKGYACGRKGYEYLIKTLEKRDYNPFGLAYLIAVYADSKNNIASYLNYIISETKDLKGLDEAFDIYNRVKGKYQKLTQLAPFKGPGQGEVKEENVKPMIKVVKECLELEDKAMSVIKTSLEG